MIPSTPPARAHKITSTQRGLLLDALHFYRRQLPAELVAVMNQLIAAVEVAKFLQE